MDFSPWDWADSFRLHEAACLIAGVPVVPKVTIAPEEIPADARQPLKQLMTSRLIYEAHIKSPGNTFPKERMLKALPSDGSEHCLSVMFSREELHRWIQAMGRKSAYSFAPVVETYTAPEQTIATLAPVEPVEKRRARYLAWFTEEERINPRGALQRVVDREAKQNSKADRSNIGKDITKARGTAKTQKQAGAIFGQLVRDGKRQV